MKKLNALIFKTKIDYYHKYGRNLMDFNWADNKASESLPLEFSKPFFELYNDSKILYSNLHRNLELDVTKIMSCPVDTVYNNYHVINEYQVSRPPYTLDSQLEALVNENPTLGTITKAIIKSGSDLL